MNNSIEEHVHYHRFCLQNFRAKSIKRCYPYIRPCRNHRLKIMHREKIFQNEIKNCEKFSSAQCNYRRALISPNTRSKNCFPPSFLDYLPHKVTVISFTYDLNLYTTLHNIIKIINLYITIHFIGHR